MTAQVETPAEHRSPWIIGLALALGLLANAFLGPVAGLVGAALGAGAGRAVVHYADDRCD
jgi:hypothetical protein